MHDALSQPALVIGNTAFVVMGTLFVFGLVALPVMRGFGLLVEAARWLLRARQAGGRPSGRGSGLEPPLELANLSPRLADLARHTRIVALELRHWDREAARWPSARDATRMRWLDAFIAPSDVAGETAATRAVFEWLRSVETLPEHDREQLAGLGVDVEGLRGLALAERAAAERVRGLAGALWTIDQRLLDAGRQDYRGLGGVRVEPTLARASESDEDDELERRRRRWVALLAQHGPGLARLAARHARTPVEREDLEQDIALALWQALPRWRSESSLKTFAYAVARYCCFGTLRRRPPHDRLEDDDALADARGLEPGLIARDELARIERAFERLPDTLGSALALRLEGRSQAEIARVLGISERNVSVRLSRARKRLQVELAAVGA